LRSSLDQARKVDSDAPTHTAEQTRQHRRADSPTPQRRGADRTAHLATQFARIPLIARSFLTLPRWRSRYHRSRHRGGRWPALRDWRRPSGHSLGIIPTPRWRLSGLPRGRRHLDRPDRRFRTWRIAVWTPLLGRPGRGLNWRHRGRSIGLFDTPLNMRTKRNRTMNHPRPLNRGRRRAIDIDHLGFDDPVALHHDWGNIILVKDRRSVGGRGSVMTMHQCARHQAIGIGHVPKPSIRRGGQTGLRINHRPGRAIAKPISLFAISDGNKGRQGRHELGAIGCLNPGPRGNWLRLHTSGQAAGHQASPN
jgi:hypothetical protein